MGTKNQKILKNRRLLTYCVKSYASEGQRNHVHVVPSCDESNFEMIANDKSSKEALDILEKAYKGDNCVKQVKIQNLKEELECMRMKKAEGVARFRVKTVVNQLGRNGVMLPTCRVVEKILRLLADDFENIVCA